MVYAPTMFLYPTMQPHRTSIPLLLVERVVLRGPCFHLYPVCAGPGPPSTCWGAPPGGAHESSASWFAMWIGQIHLDTMQTCLVQCKDLCEKCMGMPGCVYTLVRTINLSIFMSSSYPPHMQYLKMDRVWGPPPPPANDSHVYANSPPHHPHDHQHGALLV